MSLEVNGVVATELWVNGTKATEVWVNGTQVVKPVVYMVSGSSINGSESDHVCGTQNIINTDFNNKTWDGTRYFEKSGYGSAGGNLAQVYLQMSKLSSNPVVGYAFSANTRYKCILECNLYTWCHNGSSSNSPIGFEYFSPSGTVNSWSITYNGVVQSTGGSYGSFGSGLPYYTNLTGQTLKFEIDAVTDASGNFPTITCITKIYFSCGGLCYGSVRFANLRATVEQL